MTHFSFTRLRSCVRWGRPLIFSLLLTTLGLSVFVTLARRVVAQQAFSFDQAILTELARIASPALTRFMLFVSDTAAPIVLVPLALFLAVLWWRRKRADWFALVVSILGSFALNEMIKRVFDRARPDLFPHLQVAHGYSFPSGHSQAALAFYGVLAYLLARRVRPALRPVIYGLAALWIILVGLSRNYLEVHYPSDVLAAFAIALPWVLAVIFVHQCYTPSVAEQEKVIQPPASQPLN